jgi:hypothetical protein
MSKFLAFSLFIAIIPKNKMATPFCSLVLKQITTKKIRVSAKR